MIKLKSVIYLISMMTLAGCSGQKQASVAVEEQSGRHDTIQFASV